MDTKQIFWGLVIKPGRRYETEVQEAFRITKACASPSSVSSDICTVVMERGLKSMESEEEHFLLANLSRQNLSENLDTSFGVGEKICFKVIGTGTVHLTGNILEFPNVPVGETDEDDSEDEDDAKSENSEEDDSEEDDSEEDDSEEDDSEEDVCESTNNDKDKNCAIDDAELTGKDENPPKKENSTSSNKSILKTESNKVKETSKKMEMKKKAEDKSVTKNGKSVVKNGGLLVEDLEAGTGTPCRKGNGVGMYYTGRLRRNGDQFDSLKVGRPFKFKLGHGQVIKGWDLGVLGMRVGGRRRLTIPASLGYGSQGAPPVIPPNADLIFDIECKFIKVYGGNQDW